MSDETINGGNGVSAPASTPPLDEKINPANIDPSGPDIPASPLGGSEERVQADQVDNPPRPLVAHRLEMILDEQLAVSHQMLTTLNVVLGVASFLLGIAMFYVIRHFRVNMKDVINVTS